MVQLRGIMNGRPGDERGFIHKKIFGGIKGAVGGVVSGLTRGQLPTPLSIGRGALGGFLGGGGVIRGRRIVQERLVNRLGTPRPTPPRTQTARVTGTSQAQKRLGAALKLSGSNIPLPPIIEDIISEITNGNGNGTSMVVCDDPRLEPNDQGFCDFPGSPAGGVGEARMGRFGAALEPSFMTINQRQCLPGMVLGKDKLCYNKGAITNKERLWPKGAAPLLTGGEMSSIRKASGAAKKFQRAGGRLKAVGKTFIGPGTNSRRAPRAHAHARPVRAVSIPT